MVAWLCAINSVSSKHKHSFGWRCHALSKQKYIRFLKKTVVTTALLIELFPLETNIFHEYRSRVVGMPVPDAGW